MLFNAFKDLVKNYVYKNNAAPWTKRPSVCWILYCPGCFLSIMFFPPFAVFLPVLLSFTGIIHCHLHSSTHIHAQTVWLSCAIYFKSFIKSYKCMQGCNYMWLYVTMYDYFFCKLWFEMFGVDGCAVSTSQILLQLCTDAWITTSSAAFPNSNK